jgi:hypothetical protein|tara:strand:- start:14 stop:313 length:300 start_codon:yes stop_codon:yes gene_type:complete
METKEDIKIREILEKEEPLQAKKKKPKPQFANASVPNYGKSRSGKEYGGFIKESSYNKMKYKSSKGKTKWSPLFPEPQDEYEKYLNENDIKPTKGPYDI